MKKLNRGFSLIELMIVVLIIGILTSLALPSYRQHLKRARFLEVVLAAEPYKLAISLALQQGFAQEELFNSNRGIPPKPSPSSALASLQVENGVISAKGTILVDEATFILTPDASGERWQISGTCLKNGLCET